MRVERVCDVGVVRGWAGVGTAVCALCGVYVCTCVSLDVGMARVWLTCVRSVCVCGLCAPCVAEHGCLWGVSTRVPACVAGVFAGRTGGVGVEAWVCVCDVFVPLTICDLCVHVRVAVCVCVHGMCRWRVGVSVCGNG